MLAAAVGCIALSIWLYLLLGRGGFWRVREEPWPDGPPAAAKSIAVLIPARDEAAVIGRALASLAAQRYSGPVTLFVADDHSSDETAALAAQHAQVVAVAPLPSGWTGKLWALHCALQQAAPLHPDYYLLTDADIVHAPGNLAQLAARAEAQSLDLVSLMVKLRCQSLAERALIPAFLFFFLKLYPPAWIANPSARTAGAAGGCILIRREALERIGGIGAIRNRLIDDCALARAVKRSGGAIWMGVTESTCSVREYHSFAEIERMVSRTAFTQLDHSPWLLAGTVAGLALTYLAAPALALFGSTLTARILGASAWLLMAAAFVPSLRLYGRSLLWAFALPLIACFYLGATLHSALSYWSGQGGLWKGRVQDRAL